MTLGPHPSRIYPYPDPDDVLTAAEADAEWREDQRLNRPAPRPSDDGPVDHCGDCDAPPGEPCQWTCSARPF